MLSSSTCSKTSQSTKKAAKKSGDVGTCAACDKDDARLTTRWLCPKPHRTKFASFVIADESGNPALRGRGSLWPPTKRIGEHGPPCPTLLGNSQMSNTRIGQTFLQPLWPCSGRGVIRIRHKKCNIAISCHCERSEAISCAATSEIDSSFHSSQRQGDIDVRKIMADRN